MVNPGIESDLGKYPKMEAHKKRIGELPKIKHWMENRPENIFPTEPY